MEAQGGRVPRPFFLMLIFIPFILFIVAVFNFALRCATISEKGKRAQLESITTNLEPEEDYASA